MSKAVVNMTNWELYVYNRVYSLSGTADNHPSLGKNVYVWGTSELENYSFEENVLTYETQNTIYICPLKYMTIYPYTNVVDSYREELTHLAEKTECIYIEVSNVSGGSLLAYHFGEYTGTVVPSVHSGMFQDGILYMKYETDDDLCSLDFRYFPRGLQDIMETYSWSDNIKQAVIKNETGCTLRFNGVDISLGETMVFTSESHKQGLISPDCHNGKSIFSILKEDNNN